MVSKEHEQPGKIVTGIVTEALPNAMFRVEVKHENGKDTSSILAHLSGKMRFHRIKVIIGDTVEILLDQYSEGKGRVTRRL